MMKALLDFLAKVVYLWLPPKAHGDQTREGHSLARAQTRLTRGAARVPPNTKNRDAFTDVHKYTYLLDVHAVACPRCMRVAPSTEPTP